MSTSLKIINIVPLALPKEVLESGGEDAWCEVLREYVASQTEIARSSSTSAVEGGEEDNDEEDENDEVEEGGGVVFKEISIQQIYALKRMIKSMSGEDQDDELDAGGGGGLSLADMIAAHTPSAAVPEVEEEEVVEEVVAKVEVEAVKPKAKEVAAAVPTKQKRGKRIASESVDEETTEESEKKEKKTKKAKKAVE
jgi:hypothetical protein